MKGIAWDRGRRRQAKAVNKRTTIDHRTETYNMVPDNVIVSFLCEELDRETSNIANSIGAALLTTSGTETEENLGLFASGVEELGASQLSNLGVGDFKFSPGTSSLGVDDSAMFVSWVVVSGEIR